MQKGAIRNSVLADRTSFLLKRQLLFQHGGTVAVCSHHLLTPADCCQENRPPDTPFLQIRFHANRPLDNPEYQYKSVHSPNRL